MELMKRTPDKFYDLSICDPPYGIGFDGNTTVNGKAGKSKTFSNKQHHKKNIGTMKDQICFIFQKFKE